jgi:hypothetical protein
MDRESNNSISTMTSFKSPPSSAPLLHGPGNVGAGSLIERTVTMNIENTIMSTSLPCNSLAMLARLRELLEDNKTNCLSDCRQDARIKAVLWLLNSQVFGQLATIEMCEEWTQLNRDLQ